MAKPLTKTGCGPGPEMVIGLKVQLSPASVLFETPQVGGPLFVNAQFPTAYIVEGVSGSRTRMGVLPNGGGNRRGPGLAGEPRGVQLWPRLLLTYKRSESA